MLWCQGLVPHSVLCSTRAGVALSGGRERDDDGKGTRSMRASPTLLLTETDAGRKTAGDCTVSRCRFPISFHRSLSQIHTLEVKESPMASYQYKTPPPSHSHNPALSDSLPSLWVQYLPTSKVPNRETTTRSKQAAAGPLDRLVRDALQSATREGYIKIASMLGDIADAHTPLNGRCPCLQYRYWLQQQVKLVSSPSFPFLIPFTQLCSTRQLVCPL